MTPSLYYEIDELKNLSNTTGTNKHVSILSMNIQTFVDQSFQHETVLNINMHTLWEGLILQIKGGGLPKGLIIGNIYRPPRMLKEEIKQFIN